MYRSINYVSITMSMTHVTLLQVPTSDVTLFIRIRDMASTRSRIVDWFHIDLQSTSSMGSPRVYKGIHENAQVNLTYEVHCPQHHYGANCLTYCVPSNNTLSHYVCDSFTGRKISLSSYQNPKANCSEGIKNLVHPSFNIIRRY